MTVAIGFRCDDGIVLSTDTQYTMGPAKTDGPKLFICADNGNFATAIAGAGRVSFMKRAVEKIEHALKNLSSPTCQEIRLKVEDTLLQFFRDHIYPMPPSKQQGADFELILGVWTYQDGFHLYKTEETTVHHVGGNYCSIGWGFYVTDYALRLMTSWDQNIESAKLVAAMCVKAAKDHVNYCGGDTRMLVVHNTPPSRIERILPNEIRSAEDYAADLTETLRLIISILDIEAKSDATIDSEYVDAVMNNLKERIVEFREKQQKFRETASRRRERMKRKLSRDLANPS
ncbi:MAG: hypothetical protein EPN47_16315 [Acidobacteria bacterium]|nr:MAG: hypothetical protein EPN47_16315 [Acidobacteriota bacterium]